MNIEATRRFVPLLCSTGQTALYVCFRQFNPQLHSFSTVTSTASRKSTKAKGSSSDSKIKSGATPVLKPSSSATKPKATLSPNSTIPPKGTDKSAPSTSSFAQNAHAWIKGSTSNKVPTTQASEKSQSDEETMAEQMEQVDHLINMGRMFPTADPWAFKVETLDVEIPYSVNIFKLHQYPSLRSMVEQFSANRRNDIKNAMSMWTMADSNAFPGIDLSNQRLRHKVFKWPWLVFRCRSVKDDAWVSPIRHIALETYKDLNTAFAAQDSTKVKNLTTDMYQEYSTKLLKRMSTETICKWRFHREITPTQVLSIRATEGYLSSEEPRFGNRLMVHALIRFDTEQSMEIYDKKGNPLHPHDPASNQGRKTRLNVPADKKQVVEFLVLEKRMWFDGPWTIRDRLWTRVGQTQVAV